VSSSLSMRVRVLFRTPCTRLATATRFDHMAVRLGVAYSRLVGRSAYGTTRLLPGLQFRKSWKAGPGSQPIRVIVKPTISCSQFDNRAALFALSRLLLPPPLLSSPSAATPAGAVASPLLVVCSSSTCLLVLLPWLTSSP
jgi:hypothetical protein